MEREIAWTGDENRPLTLCRPCPCCCDTRGGPKGVGYLTGSDADGRGFSLWLEDEDVYQRLLAALDRAGVIA